MRFAVLVAWASLVVTIHGQTPDTGKLVYSASQDSVFLIYLNDANGSPNALGSGFLVAPHVLVTNAHVVEAGSPVLAVGPVRIPLKLIHVDKSNDLASLSVAADLTSKPLPLATDPVKPGEAIYAIGNPEGLEKTISQGIVSALRTNQGQELIQITTPISHGSSGGPVLNAKGEVVGVAVGMLEDGQNLNFAVPVKFVQLLLAEKAEPVGKFDLQEALNAVSDLQEALKKADYSAEANSPYQSALMSLQENMNEIVENSDDQAVLEQMSCVSETGLDDNVTAGAARKLVRTHPGPENEAFLAYILYRHAAFEEFMAAYSEDGTEKEAAKTRLDQRLTEVTEAAQRSLRTGKGDALLLADFVLGSANFDREAYSDAIALHTRVAAGNLTECGNDLTESAIDNLVSENDKANHPEDADRWFNIYASRYKPWPVDWDKAGDRRWGLRDWGGSATAYENAASGSTTNYGYDSCYAAKARYLETPTNADAVLADGRVCVDASLKASQADKPYFDESLPDVYVDMADVLEQRGVYQGALEYAREAVSLKPNNSRGLFQEAEVFSDLSQFDECISAAEAAIRASDGKFPYMHFRLGFCYFRTRNWTMAENSFRISAEGDKTDYTSAYNLGLTLLNEGRTPDGNDWLREALKRNPDSEMRTKILNLLQ